MMEGEKAGRTDFQYQGIAYSTDNGRNWTKYDKNPVIPNTENIKDFRDTKVFWNEKLKSWSVVFAVGNHVRFYSSPNLKDWTLTGEFGKTDGSHGGVWECPDLFPLTVEGSGETKWVLLVSLNPGGPQGGSATQYFIGDFNGTSFVPDADFLAPQWLDWGRDNYAGVTFSDAPDGRRVLIGWMSNWDYAQKVPTSPWRSAMTLPRDLSLHRTGEELRLHSRAAAEVDAIMGSASVTRIEALSGEEVLSLDPLAPQQGEIVLSFDKPAAGSVKLTLSNVAGETYALAYDAATNEFVSDRTRSGPNDFAPTFARAHRAPRSSRNARVRMRVILDRASAELFADDGATVMTETLFSVGVRSPSPRYRATARDGHRVASARAERVWP
ncbi:MAG: glycoside hydrolase family 32 protein [Blastocatellia bacterium]|nr:glycoside hydrolase family 32 protein [Blastocatellia bacterium]